MAGNCVSGEQYANFLVNQTPRYDKAIIKDMRPTDSAWIGHVNTGEFPSGEGTTLTQDRFHTVFPDTTKRWESVTNTSCVTGQCDPREHEIGMGNSRTTYSLRQQSWRSQVFCFDQMMTVTHARENVGFFISDVLKKATVAIQSALLRKDALALAGKKWLASANMTDFTGTWSSEGDSEIYYTVSALPTSKLTTPMLQRRYLSQWLLGARGQEGADSMLELCTGLEELWELEKTQPLIQAANSKQMQEANWRFTDFADGAKYTKYGWSGKIGNYACRVDPTPLRFMLADAATKKLQVVLPYRNVAATNGIKSEDNPLFPLARYQVTFVHHRMGWDFLTFRPQSINPQMQFGSRDFGGRWEFRTNDIGVPNPRQNKGVFLADFTSAARPNHTEWVEAILHLREPSIVAEVGTITVDGGEAAQVYESANTPCLLSERVLYFTPQKTSTGTYTIAANTIVCGGRPIVHAAVTDAATLAALATALNGLTGEVDSMGTWAADGALIKVTGSACATVCLPFVTT